jgi:tRNA threonylcarbamoyladenosine biosynthesis protein TsaB
MIILTLRTDKPEAEIGLYENDGRLVYETWVAHRELAETVHKKLSEILERSDKEIADIRGVVCYKGPGSFTGLRIGLTVGNALAYAQNIPVIARQDPAWLEHGIKDILSGNDDKVALPEYGEEAKTTKQKK